MLNYIWFGLIFISVVVGTITGRIDEVTEAAIAMSKTSVEIAIGLVGIMALMVRYHENRRGIRLDTNHSSCSFDQLL